MYKFLYLQALPSVKPRQKNRRAYPRSLSIKKNREKAEKGNYRSLKDIGYVEE